MTHTGVDSPSAPPMGSMKGTLEIPGTLRTGVATPKRGGKPRGDSNTPTEQWNLSNDTESRLYPALTARDVLHGGEEMRARRRLLHLGSASYDGGPRTRSYRIVALRPSPLHPPRPNKSKKNLLVIVTVASINRSRFLFLLGNCIVHRSRVVFACLRKVAVILLHAESAQSLVPARGAWT